ncbi:Retinol dehydrogenase 14 [Trichoplax sp. H2]|nr:Retinol dehydrogenase 14 [Trichoplax sp. H2]|eukprot:RDD40165.1 Retinol dehydrogenase 14 [Trichoplax sp. H2]
MKDSTFAITTCSIAAAIGVSLFFLRRYFAGRYCNSKAMMHQKTIIITGCNTGVGKETAIDLAKRGARVIMACRDDQRGLQAAQQVRQQSGNNNVTYKHLDLASFASIRQFANDIIDNEKQISVLINNAAVAHCPYSTTQEGFEMQFGVNHLGHFLLTNLLLDKLKESAPSRIVIVSSGLYKYATIDFDDLHGVRYYSPQVAYKQSKLANLLFAHELNKKLQGSGVTVNSVHPGVVRTDLGRHSEWVKSYWIVLLRPLLMLILKTPLQGAQTSIYCAVAEELEGVSGHYYGDCMEKKLLPRAKDDEIAKKLWDISCKLVNLTESKRK